jgi:hypothetical protein
MPAQEGLDVCDRKNRSLGAPDARSASDAEGRRRMFEKSEAARRLAKAKRALAAHEFRDGFLSGKGPWVMLGLVSGSSALGLAVLSLHGGFPVFDAVVLIVCAALGVALAWLSTKINQKSRRDAAFGNAAIGTAAGNAWAATRKRLAAEQKAASEAREIEKAIGRDFWRKNMRTNARGKAAQKRALHARAREAGVGESGARVDESEGRSVAKIGNKNAAAEPRAAQNARGPRRL